MVMTCVARARTLDVRAPSRANSMKHADPLPRAAARRPAISSAHGPLLVHAPGGPDPPCESLQRVLRAPDEVPVPATARHHVGSWQSLERGAALPFPLQSGFRASATDRPP